MSITERTITLRGRRGGGTQGTVFVPESGDGPGLVVFAGADAPRPAVHAELHRLAEEGWVVLGIGAGRSGEAALEDARGALETLAAQPEVRGRSGALGFGSGAVTACELAAGDPHCACAVAYDPPAGAHERLAALAPRLEVPVVVHVAGDGGALAVAGGGDSALSVHAYPGVTAGFALPGSPAFDRPAQMMAKSRTLACLREVLGPVYDIEALWEAHLYSEFAERDVDVSMATMVDDPYVFVVPTVTGGTGKERLHRWYSRHFHFQNPEDTEIVPISRTVGTDRLVDEFVFRFTHDRVMDWILPGVAPTGRRIEIPMIAVVNFRGPKLYHEHIWWDQASVLVQAGLLAADGLPVTGADQAAAMQDEHLPRNRLIPDWED